MLNVSEVISLLAPLIFSFKMVTEAEDTLFSKLCLVAFPVNATVSWVSLSFVTDVVIPYGRLLMFTPELMSEAKVPLARYTTWVTEMLPSLATFSKMLLFSTVKIGSGFRKLMAKVPLTVELTARLILVLSITTLKLASESVDP